MRIKIGATAQGSHQLPKSLVLNFYIHGFTLNLRYHLLLYKCWPHQQLREVCQIFFCLQTVLIFPLSLFSWNCLIIISFTFTFAAEMEFLRKRQVAWEDSFQSLYYMLRNGTCNIFYGNYLCPYIVFFQATFMCVYICNTFWTLLIYYLLMSNCSSTARLLAFF